MEDKPLISVLMTSYNREKYISTAIESVLSSTLTNFELIIVDDCSKDKTVEIAERYRVLDSRVKVFINKTNLGDYPNRNQAAKYAQGKYLKYVDADDYIYSWGLELLNKMMEQFPEAGWGLCSLEQNRNGPYPQLLSPRDAYLYHYHGPGLFHKAPLSSIIKRNVFEEVGGFPENRMTSDFEMWHKLALKYPLLLMPAGMVWYREHNEQEMSSYKKFILQYEKVKINYVLNNQCPLNINESEKIINELINNYVKSMIKSLIALKLNDFFDNLNKLKFILHEKANRIFS